MRLEKKVYGKAILIFVSCGVLAALSAYTSSRGDTARQGYLIRPEAGGEALEETLIAYQSGAESPVTVDVAPRLYTPEETQSYLTEAERRLRAGLQSQTDFTHTDCDLDLPEALDDLPVQIAYSTSDPFLLAFDGTLGDSVPAGGAPVRVIAELSLQENIRIVSFDLTVFPRKLEGREAFEAAVKAAVEQSSDPASEKVTLPDALNGEPVEWSHAPDRTWILILVLGLAAGILYLYCAYTQPEREAEAYREALLADYPQIASKLVLLLHAGMSTRLAIQKITLDYRKRTAAGGEIRAGYEEIAKTHFEMNRGVTELEAYRQLGKRAGADCFRTLATLLAANLTKGSATLLTVLDKEAKQAGEERRKRARIRGEKAGVKLLFPMMLMLGVVLVILIVPAFMTFF